VLLLGGVALCQSQQQQGQTQTPMNVGLSSVDRNFVGDAYAAGTAEVEQGRLAVNRASNPAVKTFAQRMVDDHTSTNQDLMQLGALKGLTSLSAIAEQQAQPKDKSRDLITKWARLSGAEFDREYMSARVTAHEKAVSLFKNEADSGSDPDVKAFAAKVLPSVRLHLKMANDVAHKVGAVDTRSGNNTGAG
jgi:putative membrane protein